MTSFVCPPTSLRKSLLCLIEPRTVASSLACKPAVSKAPYPRFQAVLASAALLLYPARHFCYIWFPKAHSLSNGLPGAG